VIVYTYAALRGGAMSTSSEEPAHDLDAELAGLESKPHLSEADKLRHARLTSLALAASARVWASEAEASARRTAEARAGGDFRHQIVVTILDKLLLALVAAAATFYFNVALEKSKTAAAERSVIKSHQLDLLQEALRKADDLYDEAAFDCTEIRRSDGGRLFGDALAKANERISERMRTVDQSVQVAALFMPKDIQEPLNQRSNVWLEYLTACVKGDEGRKTELKNQRERTTERLRAAIARLVADQGTNDAGVP
jgi:hypothetical protein